MPKCFVTISENYFFVTFSGNIDSSYIQYYEAAITLNASIAYFLEIHPSYFKSNN